MMKPIKVMVKCLFNQAFPFEFFPEMTALELSQFVLSCQLLHQAKSDDDQHIPNRLVSLSNHLLLDYMLKSPQFTIGQVHSVYRYIKAREGQASSYLKQSEFQQKQYYQKSILLPVAVYYQPKIVHKELETERILAFSHKKDFGGQHAKDMNENIQNEQWFSFYQQAHLNSSNLTLSKSILKSDLESFQKVENLFLIRKRLIEMSNESLHIYGQLRQIKEDKDGINFIFDYIPCVSFSDMMHFEFSSTAIAYMINKIWMFLLSLISNGYESYIYRLYKRRALKQLLDRISLCINHRLIITDLNILLQAGGQERFTTSEQEELIEEVTIYIKLNKSQLRKFQDRIEVDQTNSIHPISLFTFSKVFLTKGYNYSTLSSTQYQPKTSHFSWKPDPYTPNNEKKRNINQASTAKKPREQRRNPVENIRKDMNKSLNRSRGHESIKKTKCRKVHY